MADARRKLTTGDWEGALGKHGDVCAVCAETLGEGSEFVSSLEMGEDGLVRRDYHQDHFDEKRDEVFAFWHAHDAADDPDRPRPLDVNFLAEFFGRLVDAPPAARQAEVAYIVALLLVRKKVLTLVGTETTGDTEHLVVRFNGPDASPDPLRLAVPTLTEEKMVAIRDDLGRIFNLGDAPPREAPAES